LHRFDTENPRVRFDTYEIVAPIGAGGNGAVWIARHDSKMVGDVASMVLLTIRAH
jgi:hypothetical protein